MASAAASAGALRRLFEVDRHHIAITALTSLADSGEVHAGRARGRERYEIDSEAPVPMS